MELLKRPESLLVVLQELASEQANSRALKSQVDAMRPKEEYFDKLCDIGSGTSIRKTAIQFSINERTFIQYLLDEKYLYRGKDGRLTPYKRHSADGLFELKDCVSKYGYWVGAQTIITPKGKQKLMEELQNKKMLALAN